MHPESQRRGVKAGNLKHRTDRDIRIVIVRLGATRSSASAAASGGRGVENNALCSRSRFIQIPGIVPENVGRSVWGKFDEVIVVIRRRRKFRGEQNLTGGGLCECDAQTEGSGCDEGGEECVRVHIGNIVAGIGGVE